MKKLLVGLFLLGASLSSSAQVVFTFGTSSGSASATGVPGNLSASLFSQNNNFGTTTMLSSASASSGYSGASGNFNAVSSAVAGSFNVSTSTYFQFTLTPTAGYQVTLNSISFGTRSTASGATTVALRTSDDAFASNLSSAASPNGSWALVSSGALSSVTGSADLPLTIRIYGFGGTGSLSTGNWRVDDITANVTVSALPIPEPSTYAAIFGGVALIGVAIQRRRSKASLNKAA